MYAMAVHLTIDTLLSWGIFGVEMTVLASVTYWLLHVTFPFCHPHALAAARCLAGWVYICVHFGHHVTTLTLLHHVAHAPSWVSCCPHSLHRAFRCGNGSSLHLAFLRHLSVQNNRLSFPVVSDFRSPHLEQKAVILLMSTSFVVIAV